MTANGAPPVSSPQSRKTVERGVFGYDRLPEVWSPKVRVPEECSRLPIECLYIGTVDDSPIVSIRFEMEYQENLDEKLYNQLNDKLTAATSALLDQEDFLKM